MNKILSYLISILIAILIVNILWGSITDDLIIIKY